MTSTPSITLYHSFSELVTCAGGLRCGPAQGELGLITDGAIAIDDATGLVVFAGATSEAHAHLHHHFPTKIINPIDSSGQSAVPGLCDAHTHPVWLGDRMTEFSMKLSGASYMEIHAAGGGIGVTVGATRGAGEAELLEGLEGRLRRMARLGTTLVEGKSGYGLSEDAEMKQLRVLHAAGGRCAGFVDLVSTYCGAHSVPKGSTAAEAARDIIDRQLPALAALREQGLISPTLIDVFHEKGVFVEETEAILEAGKRHGLRCNFHGDELTCQGGAELGARVGALAVSHLEEATQEGIEQMARAGTVAVLLPTTAYLLRLRPPPARAMIAAGCAVALGSDFNPNAHCMSMPMVMNMACVLFRMTPEEALTAATINAAHSMGREATNGSLEPGKKADFVIINSKRWIALIYEMVDPPIKAVIKNGKKVTF
jgi:imidazolonepropionase